MNQRLGSKPKQPVMAGATRWLAISLLVISGCYAITIKLVRAESLHPLRLDTAQQHWDIKR